MRSSSSALPLSASSAGQAQARSAATGPHFDSLRTYIRQPLDQSWCFLLSSVHVAQVITTTSSIHWGPPLYDVGYDVDVDTYVHDCCVVPFNAICKFLNKTADQVGLTFASSDADKSHALCPPPSANCVQFWDAYCSLPHESFRVEERERDRNCTTGWDCGKAAVAIKVGC